MKKQLLFLLFVLQSSFAFTQNFYDQNTIQEIRLTFTDPNWKAALYMAYFYDTGYIPAQSVSINGTVFQNVGVKYKGNSSFVGSNAPKNPYHIELDAYQNQDYNGIKDIKLSNVIYDPSFLRETLAYDILNKYMHAPRANYANLYINNVLVGIYTNTESITKKFVKDHFGSDTNTFFKAAIAGGASFNVTAKPNLLYLGTNPAAYQTRYELKSVTGWNDLISLTNILNNNTSQIETVLDVDRILWMLAFNNVLLNLDSYTGIFNHNYYLYKDESGRFSPIVWDLNMSFGTFGALSQTNVINNLVPKSQISPYVQQDQANWPLINKLLANPSYKKMYLAHMYTILDENFNNDSYITKANALKTVINTAVQNDVNKFYSYAAFQNGMTTSVTVDGSAVANGISELMSLRKTYLQNHPDLSAAKPVITNIIPSQATPLINTNISFKATVTNTNSTSVFFGYRTNVNNKFVKVQMFDDGAHNDGVAGDNVYGTNPVLLNNASMQYYIYAENNMIGAFSPARAEHEFHSITATNNINPGEITINEVMAQNTSTITDPAGEYEDWIELYNTTSSPLLMDGLFLTDTSTNMLKWQFPNGISIPAGGYLMVWADEDLTEAGVHADFKLSASGESVILSKANGTIINSVTFGAQTANVSYARIPNGTGNFILKAPTFNQNNEANLATAEISDKGNRIFVYPNPSNSIINFMNENEIITKIEIYNMVGQKVDEKDANSQKVSFNIQNLQKGTYLAKIFSNKQFKTVKFIKN